MVNPSHIGDIDTLQFFSADTQNQLREVTKSADEVYFAKTKGSLMFSSDILADTVRPFALLSGSEKANIMSTRKVFVGSPGHDVIIPGRGESVTRGGPGPDHFLLRPGDVSSGKTVRVYGDGGNDTIVLTRGFSLKDVTKRTPPYEVTDPNTKGVYILDTENLGVLDPLPLSEFNGELGDTELKNIDGFNAVFSHVASSSKHYSSSREYRGASYIYPYTDKLPVHITKAAPFVEENSATTVPLGKTASPFGTYPALYSIEGGWMAVGTDYRLTDHELRNPVASALLSISSDSAGDTEINLRFLTEDSIRLRVDLASPRSVESVLGFIKTAGLIENYSYGEDRTIRVNVDGQHLVFKPLIFVARTGVTGDSPSFSPINDKEGRLAFSIVDPSGFAQTFVNISGKNTSGLNFIEESIKNGFVTDFRELDRAKELFANPQAILPQTSARIIPNKPVIEGTYPFTLEIDGGVLHLQSEFPITDAQKSGKVENLNVSISSIFYARRFAQLYFDNGERIFSVAGVMNPESTISRIRKLKEEEKVASFTIAQSLLGPIQLGLSSGRTAKMMPIMFGSRAGKFSDSPLLLTLDEDDASRFAFGIVDPESGLTQLFVDIGGSTLLPNLPKP